MRLDPPGKEEKEYARFGLELEDLEKQVWSRPVESSRGLERPKGLRIPLLVLDMEKVKSKEIGEKCTGIERCQRWSLLEWARMNPQDLCKFFERMPCVSVIGGSWIGGLRWWRLRRRG